MHRAVVAVVQVGGLSPTERAGVGAIAAGSAYESIWIYPVCCDYVWTGNACCILLWNLYPNSWLMVMRFVFCQVSPTDEVQVIVFGIFWKAA